MTRDLDRSTRMMARFFVNMRQRSLVVNSSSLLGATTVTGLLGFVFWTLATHLTSINAVGAASAAVSAMQLVGSLATLGLNTLLLGELSKRPANQWQLLGGSLLVSGTTALVGGLGVGALIGRVSVGDGSLFSGAGPLALFALGCAATATTLVLDQALIGLSKSGPQLARNAVFAVVKLVLLPVFAVFGQLSAVQIYLVWFLGHVVSLVPMLLRSGPAFWMRLVAAPTVLCGRGRSALAHHWINVSTHAPQLVLPVLVVAVLGAAENGPFYAALLLVTCVWVVHFHISTALFALAAGNPSRFRHELRFSLRVCATVSLATVIGFAALAKPLLMLFGPDYLRASMGLVVLALATPASAVKFLYIAVCRVQGRLARGALVTCAGSACEIAAAGACLSGGITAVCGGFAVALTVEGLLLWPRLGRAAGINRQAVAIWGKHWAVRVRALGSAAAGRG